MGSDRIWRYFGYFDLQLRKYNITYLPSIIINEKTVLEGFHSPDEIEKYLKE